MLGGSCSLLQDRVPHPNPCSQSHFPARNRGGAIVLSLTLPYVFLCRGSMAQTLVFLLFPARRPHSHRAGALSSVHVPLYNTSSVALLMKYKPVSVAFVRLVCFV